MKKAEEFYKRIFKKLFSIYGYLPYPKETADDEELRDILFEAWDDALGDFKEDHIMEGLKKCIMDNEDKMPRLPKIVKYVHDSSMEERSRDFANPKYEEDYTKEKIEDVSGEDTAELLQKMLDKVRSR